MDVRPGGGGGVVVRGKGMNDELRQPNETLVQGTTLLHVWEGMESVTKIDYVCVRNKREEATTVP